MSSSSSASAAPPLPPPNCHRTLRPDVGDENDEARPVDRECPGEPLMPNDGCHDQESSMGRVWVSVKRVQWQSGCGIDVLFGAMR